MNYSLTEQLTNDTFLGYPVYEKTILRAATDLGLPETYTVLNGSDVDVIVNLDSDTYPTYVGGVGFDWASSQSYGGGYSVIRYIKAQIL